MQPYIISTLTITSAEIGDKTQLLALILASRFKKPMPIILGILVATLMNHALAGVLGSILGNYLQGKTFDVVLAGTFFLTAIWALIPDKFETTNITPHNKSIFLTTLITFFIAEIGDKTQVATMMLAAEYQAIWQVVCGTTLGMMMANIPVVLFGNKAAHYLPIKPIRFLTAAIFAAIACVILARVI